MSTCLRRREFLGAIGGAAASGARSSASAALGALPGEAGANPAEADRSVTLASALLDGALGR
jgi:hypothetical protein